jgi:hypothetical protein
METIGRRQFLGAAAAPLLSALEAGAAVLPADDHISISTGRIDVKSPWFGDEKWGLTFHDVLINGLTVPKFTWGWLGINLAGGVVAKVGGLVFDVLLSALGLGGPNMEELLRKQLEEIEKIVERKFREHELRRCSACLDHIERLMREFVGNRKLVFRLTDATTDSSRLMSDLLTLDFHAYRMYMISANLRLAILQEWAALDPAEVKNYNEALGEYMRCHASWKRRAETDLSVNGQIKKWVDRHVPDDPVPDGLLGMKKYIRAIPQLNPMSVQVEEPVFGIAPGDLPRLPPERIRDVFAPEGIRLLNPPLAGVVDWKAVQDRVLPDLKIGDAIVQAWQQAKWPN